MRNLLKSELFKLTKNRAIKIVMIITAIYTVAMAFFWCALGKWLGLGGVEGAEGLGSLGGLIGYIANPKGYTAPGAAMASDSQTLFILMAVAVCSVIVTDNQRGIMRNLLTSGYSRSAVYFTKLIICAGLAVAMILFSVFVYILLGTAFFGFGSVNIGRFLLQILLLILLTGAFASILVLISTVTKNTGASIGLSIALIYVFALIPTVSMLLSINSANATAAKIVEFIGEMYAGNLISYAVDFTLKTSKIIQYFITAVTTIGLTSLLGSIYFNRADLK